MVPHNNRKKEKCNSSKYYFQRLQKRKRAQNIFLNNNLYEYGDQCNYYHPLYNWSPPNYNYWENGVINYWDNQFSTSYYNSIDGGVSGTYGEERSSEPYSQEPIVDRVVKEKRRVFISAPTNLKSLIDIIDSNEVNDEIEYNIDLKSLKNIRSELIELRDMVGMEKMKKSVFQQLIYFVQNLHIGNNNGSDFKHTVLLGPPGTGKTRVAKIIGNMYSKMGVLKKNIFKKVTRNDLIAGYLGQTAIKTQKVVEDCLGGVLFIDEAYSLAPDEKDDMFSKECLDTLCEALSDHKDDLMVIIAGYENELNSRFFAANQGLESRFIWRFKIEEYSAVELMMIFLTIVQQSGWEMLPNQINERWFQEKKDKFQGLGRDMEILFTYAKMAHGLRIYGEDSKLRKKISLDDIDNAYKTFLDNLKKDDRPSFINSIYI